MPNTSSEQPAVWRLRGGGAGEYETEALDLGVALLGFQEIPDLTMATTQAKVATEVQAALPRAKSGQVRSLTGQLTSFRLRMAQHDLVAMPLKQNPGQVAIGRVTGPYEYRLIGVERRHIRAIEWQNVTISKDRFRDDLVVRLNLPATVIQIRRRDAARRIQAVLNGEPDPGVPTPTADANDDQLADPSTFELALSTDPEERILEHIRQLFPDHQFAELVDAVLAADGYVTFRSPPGPDAGADILGGRGPLGFDSPKLCVQVKATQQPVGTPDLDRLAGAMEKHGANRGLFVSWSGFTKPANDEARRSYFRMRLWSGRDLLYEIFRLYDRLPADIRAKIPLKQVWTLVGDDDQ